MNVPFPKALKNPWVLGIGAAVGVALLVLAARSGKAPSTSGGDVTLASQNITTNANVALAGYTTDYNKAALAYNAATAANAVRIHETDVGAATALALAHAQTLDNIAAVASQVGLVQAQGAQAIALNMQQNQAYLDAQELNAKTTITLAPHIEALAQISATADVQKASIAASTATTLASINQATQTRQIVGNTLNGVVSGLPALINSLPSAASVAELFG